MKSTLPKWPTKPPTTDKTSASYAKRKIRSAKAQKTQSESGRDIANADPPWIFPCRNSERRAECQKNFRLFCETYFPETFDLNWSDDHLRVIAKIEEATLNGGLFALAMPRGSGKTTLSECASIWAVLYGFHRFVMLIAATEAHAVEMLESLKTELETNDGIWHDFSEVVGPIRALEGITHRAAGQIYYGKSTHIGWRQNEVVIPTIEKSNASGTVLRVAGLTGRIRGAKFKQANGKSIRPSLVILDDPQTDESAKSLTQCEKRERILAGAVLGLSGPGKKISGIMPCTVIRQDDMADRLLNRDIHPQWQGERTKMVYSFPTNEKLWQRYADIRDDSLRQEKGLQLATEFYAANRDAMDEGAIVAWADRFNVDEISAIQNAMNLKLQDEQAFFAEYQNEPLPSDDLGDEQLTSDDLVQRLNGYERRHVPASVQNLVAMIDVQKDILPWSVIGIESDFTGSVIDYGGWPDQSRAYWTLRDLRATLGSRFPDAGLEGSIYAGLQALTDELLGREWPLVGGGVFRIGMCLIDANWGASTDVVYQFCRQSSHAAVLMPCHGRFVGASSVPFSEHKKTKGERVGHNWRIPNVSGKRSIRHVIFDSNYWKTFVRNRFLAHLGDRGAFSLFGRSTETHRMYAEQMTAEFTVRVAARNREVDEWKLHPGRDNHLLDTTVGCCVAASIMGAQLPGTGEPSKKKKKVKLSDLRQKLYG